MAETTTPNYKWIKPDIGGDASNWGNVLNATTDAIDSVVYANQQAGVPIGSIVMWAGNFPPPTNWLGCIGVSLNTTTYAKLFAIIGYTYGGSGANFNLPDLRDIFPIGVGASHGLGAKGGLATVTLDATMIPNHAHTATQGTHSHGVNQWAHSHGITTGGHAHTISTGAHAHSGVVTGLQGGLPGGPIAGGAGGNLIMGNTSTQGDLGGGTSTVGNLGGNTDAQTSSVSVVANSAGTITVNPTTGGGQPHTNMPPWLGINFIIRFQ